jgi:hypothetical protein
MNEIKLIAFASIVAILTSACGGGSGSGSGNDDVTTPDVILSPTMSKQILISELLSNPATLPEALGEWFEIQNAGTDKLSLQNCVFIDAAFSSFSIDFDLIIEAGEYLTFAISENPGFAEDYSYNATGLTLTIPADILTLTCNGIVIDSRNYTLSSPGSSSSLSNNGNSLWCDDLGSTYNGDTGTPGLANINC